MSSGGVGACNITQHQGTCVNSCTPCMLVTRVLILMPVYAVFFLHGRSFCACFARDLAYTSLILGTWGPVRQLDNKFRNSFSVRSRKQCPMFVPWPIWPTACRGVLCLCMCLFWDTYQSIQCFSESRCPPDYVSPRRYVVTVLEYASPCHNTIVGAKSGQDMNMTRLCFELGVRCLRRRCTRVPHRHLVAKNMHVRSCCMAMKSPIVATTNEPR
jgi:hypothetical protein